MKNKQMPSMEGLEDCEYLQRYRTACAIYVEDPTAINCLNAYNARADIDAYVIVEGTLGLGYPDSGDHYLIRKDESVCNKYFEVLSQLDECFFSVGLEKGYYIRGDYGEMCPTNKVVEELREQEQKE